MMLFALGLFLFETDSLLPDDLARRRAWRHGRAERFGARPAGQYLGPGDDVVTISGRLVPQIAGRYSAIETLAEMAGSGDAFPLGDGSGTIWGHYTIDSLEEGHTALMDGGRARAVDFRLELTRVE